MFVKTLDQEYRVYFHYDTEEIGNGLEAYTGDTTCVIYAKSDNGNFDKVVGYGDSSCAPEDQFNKREGRKIAMTRAMKQLNLTRTDRVLFWKTLFPSYFRS